MATPETIYQQLCDHVRETALLASVEELVGWDERTCLPVAAGPYRAEQITYLAGIVHQRRTDPRIGEWLCTLTGSALAEDPHSPSGTTIRQLRREYDKLVKLPSGLVERITRATVLGQQTWVESRKAGDFDSFAPALREIIQLKQEQADAIGYATCRYDALLDDYEPGETTEHVAEVLAALRQELVPLVACAASDDRSSSADLWQRDYPVSRQEAFGRQAAAKIGFDFQRGRLDVTHHPFCATVGPNDCRITTRYDQHHFPGAFFGILHEAGHGLYDQGLPIDDYGLPPGTYVSLGIHESQSRMWENQVGRSRAFWEHYFPRARQAFAEALSNVALDDFYFAINQVRPSLIRVEADEATYNLHIVVRFELEQALMDGQLCVADLPAAWNEKYNEYLGVVPTNVADGVLQDIHWSAGLIGYFPTYALGNLYAAQFFQQASADLGTLDRDFARGEFSTLLDWLRENIHTHGQCYSAEQLVQRVTGRPLGHGPLMQHLQAKFS